MSSFDAPPVSSEEIEIVKASFQTLQDELCAAFSSVASDQPYFQDRWDYAKGDGGGKTCIWSARKDWTKHGHEIVPQRDLPLPYWEKGGVGWSGIHGTDLPAAALRKWDVDVQPGTSFVATGVSLVMHPSNPWVPSVHANVRFFHAAGVWWFGGGVDLTPYYPRVEQMIEVHNILERVCAEHGVDYATHKVTCDNYFLLPHREETRGIGGVFFDALHLDGGSFAATLDFAMALGRSVIKIVQLFENNAFLPFTRSMRDFQRYRRGRYVEFNLLFDRGTKFGITSGGRSESILMSLPATVHWDYNYMPVPDSMEAFLYAHFLKPQDWHCPTNEARQKLIAAMPEPKDFASFRPCMTKQSMPYDEEQSPTSPSLPTTVLIALAAAGVGAFVGKKFL